ncbi:DUF4279 domain-containing protein [Hydrogenophaga sp. PAMC20947]|uniref:DUF4279 domain-containing protein n=1 Tax=Hydrogenophaga sp. PAMC20947 TaxID=2565558 RepID=UPI00109E111C|nr:DUF4279 domain-containing protein [Hydrogenophaga sp. PAMC20947]QCB45522.1 DUF4279 domain-containing protein [Hydrogenophaga sp. PAMC20947]
MQPSVRYDDEYATCVSTFVWLRVMSETLEPDSVTRRLHVQPTRTQLRGALPAPNSKYPYKYSGWFLESDGQVQSRDARRHLDWLLSQLTGKGKVFAELMAEGNKVDVCCKWESVGQGGPLLSPPQLEGLAQLGLELWFDVYFAGQDGVV